MAKRKLIHQPLGEICKCHIFESKEIECLRNQLLVWFDVNKRDLPWRTEARREDINERAYAVWVSEIMLQQTQVQTVIDYYKRWMNKWPTLKALSMASLEEVHQMWSGLGYYSRGSRLHEAAIKVEKELDGKIPQSAESLERQLPGVGRYTAGAIASIALGQVTGLVDGNVSRVFSRMRAVGADSSSSCFIDQMWKYANETVDNERPGDFNQALMELGATVCTPKNPACSTCPVKNLCSAREKLENQKAGSTWKKKKRVDTELKDIEEASGSCQMCLEMNSCWDESLGVCNFPRKSVKKAARKERTVVFVIHRKTKDNHMEYFITQRPPKGLLAGLWEFPNVYLDDGSNLSKILDVDECLFKSVGIKLADVEAHNHTGQVVHLFSHIHQTYIVYSVLVNESREEITCKSQSAKWVCRDDLLESAISTAMKKVFKNYESNGMTSKVPFRQKNATNRKSSDGKKQVGLDVFFKKKTN